MARKNRSPQRTFSNAGPLPVFNAHMESHKAVEEDAFFPVDCLSAIDVALWLEHRQDIVRFRFEPERYELVDRRTGEIYSVIPDFGAETSAGDLEVIEAKSKRSLLSADDLHRFDNTRIELYERPSGRRIYRVVFRDELQQNGFIATIRYLRRYGQLSHYSVTQTARALERLYQAKPLDVDHWRMRAHQKGVRLALLYHLLYHQRLPLTYKNMLPPSLLICRE